MPAGSTGPGPTAADGPADRARESAVTPATPLDALLAPAGATVSAVRAPLRQVERDLAAALEAAYAGLRRA